jgi:hypothetical protein
VGRWSCRTEDKEEPGNAVISSQFTVHSCQPTETDPRSQIRR